MTNRGYWSFALVIAVAALTASCAASTVSPTTSTAVASPTSLSQATQPPATPTSLPTATAQLATATSVPTATSQPATAQPATATVMPTVPATTAPSSTSSTGQSGKIDINKILPPGKGQTLLLNNCTSCHSFVCAVTGQRTIDYWKTVEAGHRDRVPSLSDDDFNTLFAYLEANFNDSKPVPELPPELAGIGCSAQ